MSKNFFLNKNVIPLPPAFLLLVYCVYHEDQPQNSLCPRSPCRLGACLIYDGLPKQNTVTGLSAHIADLGEEDGGGGFYGTLHWASQQV